MKILLTKGITSTKVITIVHLRHKLLESGNYFDNLPSEL